MPGILRVDELQTAAGTAVMSFDGSGKVTLATNLGKITLPTWTTSTRPSAVIGLIGYNTTTNQVEIYDGTWDAILAYDPTVGLSSLPLQSPNSTTATYKFFNVRTPGSVGLGNDFTTASGTSGGWPHKHLGRFQLRGYTAGSQPGGQYLHIRTNIPCTSYMTFWRAEGYLYNNGNIWSRAGCYPYNDTVINIFINNSGSSLIDGFYASSQGGGGNNRLCIRLNRQGTGYSEGRFDLWCSGHSDGDYGYVDVERFVYTDSASNQF